MVQLQIMSLFIAGLINGCGKSPHVYIPLQTFSHSHLYRCMQCTYKLPFSFDTCGNRNSFTLDSRSFFPAYIIQGKFVYAFKMLKCTLLLLYSQLASKLVKINDLTNGCLHTTKNNIFMQLCYMQLILIACILVIMIVHAVLKTHMLCMFVFMHVVKLYSYSYIICMYYMQPIHLKYIGCL